MPWKGVTVNEQRQRFLEDYQLNYYSITEPSERFGISRNTAHKWINRFKQYSYHEISRRPHTCPWQTDQAIAKELVKLRKAYPRWGPRKLLDLMHRPDPKRRLPSVATAARILAREGPGEAKASLPARSSRLSQEHSKEPQRHLGSGL